VFEPLVTFFGAVDERAGWNMDKYRLHYRTLSSSSVNEIGTGRSWLSR
jgi:hypothetical protein